MGAGTEMKTEKEKKTEGLIVTVNTAVEIAACVTFILHFFLKKSHRNHRGGTSDFDEEDQGGRGRREKTAQDREREGECVF